MTKTISTLAALFLATSALSSAAEAGGGVRLQFGGPLGSFTAHPHLSSGPGGTARYAQAGKHSYKRHISKPAYVAAARRKAPSIDVAQQVPEQPRKAKIAVERPVKVKPVYTAKLVDKDVTNDAAPAINVPRTPELPVVGTQSTPAPVDTNAKASSDQTVTETAALHQAEAKPTVSVAPDAEPQTGTVAATTEPATETSAPVTVATPAETVKDDKAKNDSMAARICRRFSAAIAGLIEVPCE